MRIINKVCCAAIIATLGTAAAPTRVNAAEFGANTPYYEDDSWYDITEWFDGNDYNPTDEAWWRWDDETYETAEDTSGDLDSDWYGYTARDGDDWWYDYYDPYLYGYYDYDDNDIFESASRYYDYDNDGYYDAFASYIDLDNDGVYEDFDYYSFGDTGQSQQPTSSQQLRSSKQQSVSGRVQKTKLVQVRDGSKHAVVAIQPQGGQSRQAIIADLGRANELRNLNPKLGDNITIKGPRAKIGNRTIVLARSVETNGQSRQLNRNPRTMTAQVIDTRTARVQGQSHLIAIVEPTKRQSQQQQQQPSRQQGHQAQQGQQKIAVDLGPADQLQLNIRKGSTISFSGFPVKVNDRAMFMAQSLRQGQQFVQINRQPGNVGGSSSESSSPSQRGQSGSKKQGSSGGSSGSSSSGSQSQSADQ